MLTRPHRASLRTGIAWLYVLGTLISYCRQYSVPDHRSDLVPPPRTTPPLSHRYCTGRKFVWVPSLGYGVRAMRRHRAERTSGLESRNLGHIPHLRGAAAAPQRRPQPDHRLRETFRTPVIGTVMKPQRPAERDRAAPATDEVYGSTMREPARSPRVASRAIGVCSSTIARRSDDALKPEAMSYCGWSRSRATVQQSKGAGR